MAKIWDDFSKWLDDASQVITREAGDLTVRGKLKVEIFDLKWRLKDLMADFGRLVYELAVIKNDENWQKETRVRNLVNKIKTTMKNLKVKESEYKKIGS